jgi:hypothetical protein
MDRLRIDVHRTERGWAHKDGRVIRLHAHRSARRIGRHQCGEVIGAVGRVAQIAERMPFVHVPDPAEFPFLAGIVRETHQHPRQ